MGLPRRTGSIDLASPNTGQSQRMLTCGVPTDFLQEADRHSHRLVGVCGGRGLIGAIFCEAEAVKPYGDDLGMISRLLMSLSLSLSGTEEGIPSFFFELTRSQLDSFVCEAGIRADAMVGSMAGFKSRGADDCLSIRPFD
ncbi:hypothetical protein BDW62DRAFT_81689 [Aspergillus aurantiobrunneus]